MRRAPPGLRKAQRNENSGTKWHPCKWVDVAARWFLACCATVPLFPSRKQYGIPYLSRARSSRAANSPRQPLTESRGAFHSRRGDSMTPATQALAFRIWQYCEPRGWDCTHGEVAEALGVPRASVSTTAHWRGWAGRFRSQTAYSYKSPFEPTRGAARDIAAQYRGFALDE
jgi:hypothetical protein